MSTYFIMYSERVNSQIKIIFSKISYRFMAQWKKLAEQGKDTESNYSGAKARKYTPKKSFREENSPMRFHNQTIDKINSSALSEQRQRPLGRSFVAKSNEHQQPMGLKTSSSEIKLNIQSLGANLKKTHTFQSHASLNIPPTDNQKLLQKNKSDALNTKIQKSILFQQIQKLKKQFKTFQSTILRQLNRQEKLINTMVQQILNKIKQLSTAQKQQNFHIEQINAPLTPQSKHETFVRGFSKKNSLNQSKQDLKSVKSKYQGGLRLNIENQNLSQDYHDRQKNATGFSFDKFFRAVDSLKRQLKELNDISQFPSINSPINNRRNYEWEQFRIA